AGDLGQERRAKLSAAAEDKVDRLGRRLFGGANEIAFVFAVFRVDDDNDLALRERIDGRLDRGKTGHDAIIDGDEGFVLEREEYIEQAHLFRTLSERLAENVPMQELLGHVKQEILSTTRLPLAIDFLLTELKHAGMMSTAMERLSHYFTPFQTYVMREAEAERGRFDLRIAVEILRHEAEYRAKSPVPQAMFMYQFECVCRN